MAETAPKVVEVVANKSKLMTELLETIVVPCIDLCNAHSIPIRGATISALCRTPSKRRKALIETLAEAPVTRRTATRSQAGAVGLSETSPNAHGRPKAPVAEPVATKPKMSQLSDDDTLAFLRTGRLKT
jgi:hypothetical protein